jgi:ribonuclease HII
VASVPTDRQGQASLFAPAGEGLDLDNQLRADGFDRIAGIDEAGRGPLAGPVVAAVVILTPDLMIEGLNDSKKMTELKREEAFQRLHELRGEKVFFGIGQSSADEIDRMGILPATFQAMARSVENMTEKGAPSINEYLFVIDGRDKVPNLRHLHQMPVIRGDGRSPSVAAASVLAKVHRDRQMIEHSKEYPDYGFAQHKGYGTKRHLDALESHGPCPLHRRSFAPVKKAQGRR